MSLTLCGMHYKTSEIAVRERIAFVPEQVDEVLKAFTRDTGATEAAVLSTCHRTEVYSCGTTADSIIDWMSHYQGVSRELLQRHLYTYQEENVVRHLLRVAIGLDSMVIGESQIQSQLKIAYQKAATFGTLGRELRRLFQYIFFASKNIRSQTGINSSAISIAYCAVQLARHIFADFSKTRVLLIGAGETTELLIRYLQQRGVVDLCVANRSLERAEKLARQRNIKIVPLSLVSEELMQRDMVFSATSSPLPLIGKGMVESAIKKRKHKPLLLVDLASPRDIEAEVASLDDVFLYTVDDLQAIVSENLKHRYIAASEAEALVSDHVQEYMLWQKSLSAVTTIKSLREHGEALKQIELKRALEALASGDQLPEQVLLEFAHRFANKFLHIPTVKIREASLQGQLEMISAVEWLFGLSSGCKDL